LWSCFWSLPFANVLAAKTTAPTAMAANDKQQTCNSDLQIISSSTHEETLNGTPRQTPGVL
jgi:hypothetical protein